MDDGDGDLQRGDPARNRQLRHIRAAQRGRHIRDGDRRLRTVAKAATLAARGAARRLDGIYTARLDGAPRSRTRRQPAGGRHAWSFTTAAHRLPLQHLARTRARPRRPMRRFSGHRTRRAIPGGHRRLHHRHPVLQGRARTPDRTSAACGSTMAAPCSRRRRFTSETASGWQEVKFARPVSITAGHDLRRLVSRAVRPAMRSTPAISWRRRGSAPLAGAAGRPTGRERRVPRDGPCRVSEQRSSLQTTTGSTSCSRRLGTLTVMGSPMCWTTVRSSPIPIRPTRTGMALVTRVRCQTGRRRRTRKPCRRRKTSRPRSRCRAWIRMATASRSPCSRTVAPSAGRCPERRQISSTRRSPTSTGPTRSPSRSVTER